MGEEGPSKSDLNAVFKKLRSYAANKVCFDCGAKNPTWSSVTYGVFICIDCSAIHRGLGVHVSFVRSTQLDTNWTWLQLRAMQCGGNNPATQFFRQHGCTTTDAQQKYKSRAAQLYREKLHHAAAAAMRMHGTKLHIDSQEQSSPTPQGAEETDFFAEHENEDNTIPRTASQIRMSDEMYMGKHEETGEGPSVDTILDDKDGESPQNARKALIGQRKPQAKKAGMGGKKGGLGAQKVSAKFSEIEKQAEVMDKEREDAAKMRALDAQRAKEDPEPEMTGLSTRLMVQDIGNQRKKEEEKLKHSDPKKADQLDRLGMGFIGQKSGVSHSAVSGITEIKQEGVRSKRMAEPKRRQVEEDDWEILNKEPSTRNAGGLDDLNGFESTRIKAEDDDFFSSFDAKPKDNYGGSAWDREDRKATSRGGNVGKSSTNWESSSSYASEDAQKKFGNAKAISSDQYFGDKGADFETRTNLEKYSGATGIGSAEFFGGGSTTTPSGGGYASHMPDMADVKDSVRQGVSKVGSKISSFSSGISSYMSDHYGGY